jgi:hypothetical protein
MKSLFSLIVIFLFVPCTVSLGQEREIIFRSGLILEASIPKIRADHYELDNFNYKYVLKSESFHYYPLLVDFHFSFKLDYCGNIIEARPGIRFGGDYFGVETGFFYRREIYKTTFLFTGLNVHGNFGIESGNSSGFSVEGGWYFNPVFGLGFGFVNKLSFISSFEYVKERKIYSSHSYLSESSSQNYRFLFWLMKFGVEYNL